MSAETGPRAGHPYFMYDAILGQPAAFARVVDRLENTGAAPEEPLARAARVFVVGIGTSYHAAQIGEHLLRTYAGGLPAHAYHAFDFALYGPPLGPQDAVVGVSHRGTKRYTAAALARARGEGCSTVLITGEGGPAGAPPVDETLHTIPQERSSAHTISYTGSVAALAWLADRIGGRRTGRRPLGVAFLSGEVPAALRTALVAEPRAAELARAHAGRRRIWVAGGGPGAVVAHEIALKIKETSYLQAEGLSVEAMLHGPFQCVDADDLFVLIAHEGPAAARVADLAAEVRTIGAAMIVVGDGAARGVDESAWLVPPMPEPFVGLTSVVPLQLFAYHLALVRGTNPDGFRLDDPRFARAYKQVTL
jgi:glucosamine--fructose-6-phosphate aminotransferase (isomerizing)